MLEFVKHKLGYEDVSGINNLCRYELPDGTVIEADDIADSHKILVDPELLGEYRRYYLGITMRKRAFEHM